MKNFVLLGYSDLQKNIINIAKKKKLSITIVDKNLNNIDIKKVKNFYKCNSKNSDRIIKFLKKKKIDKGISYCGSDFGIKSYQKINKFLSKDYKDFKYIEINKINLKKKLYKTNVPLLSNLSILEAKKLVKKDKIIVKPANSSGSRGVSLASNNLELKDSIRKAKKFSKKIVIEKFISGNGLDINGFIFKGKLIKCGAADRFFSKGKYKFPISGIFPSMLDEKIIDKAYEYLEKAAVKMNYKIGPIKADYIVKNKKLTLLEISTRFHGDVLTSNTNFYYSNQNPINFYIDFFLNKKKKPKIEKKKNFGVMWHSIFLKKPKKKLILSDLSKKLKSLNKKYKVLDLYIRNTKIVEHKDNTSINGFLWIKVNRNKNSFKVLYKKLRLLLRESVIT